MGSQWLRLKRRDAGEAVKLTTGSQFLKCRTMASASAPSVYLMELPGSLAPADRGARLVSWSLLEQRRRFSRLAKVERFRPGYVGHDASC